MPAKLSRTIFLALAMAFSAPAASQAQPAPKPNLTGPVSCASLKDPSLLSRVETLYSTFATKWLQIGEHWFQAYELPGEARNPLTPKGGRIGPVRGYTWIQFPRCLAQQDQTSGAWHIRVAANRITFNESSGWTRPLTAGILAQFILTPASGDWTVTDTTAAVSFRQPEDKEWRPAVGDLPQRVASPSPAATAKR